MESTDGHGAHVYLSWRGSLNRATRRPHCREATAICSGVPHRAVQISPDISASAESPAPTVLRGLSAGNGRPCAGLIDQNRHRTPQRRENGAARARDEGVSRVDDRGGLFRLSAISRSPGQTPANWASSSEFGLMRCGAARSNPAARAASGASEVSTCDLASERKQAFDQLGSTSCRPCPAAANRTESPRSAAAV